MVSAGDNGSAGCDGGTDFAVNGQAVNGFGSTPYNVSVGGTDFEYSSYSQGDSRHRHAARHVLEHDSKQQYTRAFLSRATFPSSPGTTASSASTSSAITTTTATRTTMPAAAAAPATVAYLLHRITPLPARARSPSPATPSPHGNPVPACPADGVRDLPDVSLFAANGYNDSYYPESAPPTATARLDRQHNPNLRRRRHLGFRAFLRRHHGAGQPEIRPPGPSRHRPLST